MKLTISIAVLSGLLLVSGGAGAQQSPSKSSVVDRKFEIPSQPVSDALNHFARQTGLQVVIDWSEGSGIVSSKLSGNYTPETALKALLAGTGLGYEFLSEKVVAIRKGGKEKASSMSGPADQMRLATAGTERDTVTASSAADVDAGNQVVVRDSKARPAPFSTANLDLTRTEDDALPFTVFTARDIELSGVSNLQEFLQNRLPQNVSEFPSVGDQFGGESGGNPGSVNMRGWGDTETVFLLNGRRMARNYMSTLLDNTNTTPNLEGIPIGSIERIEVLSSAGSALYGANATGGVINIITRQDFTGGQVSLNYESPADVHRPRRNISLSYGQPIAWGMGLRLGAGYSDVTQLLPGDRADVSIARWRRLATQRDPSKLYATAAGNPFVANGAPIYGATPNIAANRVSDLFVDLPGNQNFTTVPTGSTGTSPLSAYQPGVWNLDQAEGSSMGQLHGGGVDSGPNSVNTTFSLGVDKNFGEGWRWSVDYRYVKNESVGRANSDRSFVSANPQTTSTASAPLVPGAAPTNPFRLANGQGIDVLVRLVDPGLDRPELRGRTVTELQEVTSTLRGALGQWLGVFDVTYSESRNDTSRHYFLQPYGGWQAAFLSGAYNPFVDSRVAAHAAPEFYENYIARRTFYGSSTRTYQSTLKASGPLLRLPAGDLSLTAGLDWTRADRHRSELREQFQDGVTGAPAIPLGGTTDVASNPDLNAYRLFVFDDYAGYAEATAPLVSAARNLPLVHGLELFASGRWNHSIRSGFRSQTPAQQQNGVLSPVKYTNDSHLYAFGLRYQMLEGVAFRVSQSIGFKPPGMFQITPELGPPQNPANDLDDPVRGEENAVDLDTSMYVTGGNPELKAETTDSFDVGLILSPRWLPGFRLSLDYLNSVRNDAIHSISVQDAINLEADIPGLVTRDLPDGHVSGVGPISFVDARMINLREINQKSLDISLEQSFDNLRGGRLVATAAASKNLSYRIQATSFGVPVEQIRNNSGFGALQIEWNANAQLSWEGSQWGFGWSTRFFDYMLARPADILLQGSDRAPWKLTHDFNVSYRGPSVQDSRGLQWLLSGTSITFGVKNVFNRAPRFWATSPDRGVAPYDSIAGRTITVGFRKDL